MRSFLVCAVLAIALPVMALEVPELSESALKKAMESSLRDADSAKFKGIKYKESRPGLVWDMCGEVNAKNAYGGYTGFERFSGSALRDTDGDTMYFVYSIGQTAEIMCARAGL